MGVHAPNKPRSAPITWAACFVPPQLKGRAPEAREKRDLAEQLKDTEDREITTLIKKSRKRSGANRSPTGENRRKSWQTDSVAALPGVATYQASARLGVPGRHPDPAGRFAWRGSSATDRPSDDRQFQVSGRKHANHAEDDHPGAVGAALSRRPRRRSAFGLIPTWRTSTGTSAKPPQGGARLRRRRLRHYLQLARPTSPYL